MLSSDFALAYSPLPAVVGVLLAVVTARIAAAVAARRPARLDPTEALRESAVEPSSIGKGRLVTGLVFGAGGPGHVDAPGSTARTGRAGRRRRFRRPAGDLGGAVGPDAGRRRGPSVRRTAAPQRVARASAGRRQLRARPPSRRRHHPAGTRHRDRLGPAVHAGHRRRGAPTTSPARASPPISSSPLPPDWLPNLVDAIEAEPAVRAANPITRTQALFTTGGDSPSTDRTRPGHRSRSDGLHPRPRRPRRRPRTAARGHRRPQHRRSILHERRCGRYRATATRRRHTRRPHGDRDVRPRTRLRRRHTPYPAGAGTQPPQD